MDPVSLAVRPAIGLATKLLAEMTTQAKFDKARDEQLRDWVPEIAEQLAKLEKRFGEALARLTEADERLFHMTMLRLTPEAIGALTPDHRSLLAVASANVLRPDFDIETKSRAIRVLNTLEPGDVVHLRSLAAESRPMGPDGIGAAVARQFRRADAEYRQEPERLRELFRESALRSALCLDDNALVTLFGQELLRYVEQWKPNAIATAETT
jgi:hypothetical protein